MLRRMLTGMLCAATMIVVSGCPGDEDDNELVVLGGKYFMTDVNGAGFVHDTVLATVSDAHDIRLSSSDGRLSDTPMQGIMRDTVGSYIGTVPMGDLPSSPVADVELVVEDDHFKGLKLTLNGIVVEAPGSDEYPWNGMMSGELFNGDGSSAGPFTVNLVTGVAGGGLWFNGSDNYALTGFVSDLGTCTFHTVEGWPASGVALNGVLWIGQDVLSEPNGSGLWSSATGGASGTWIAD
jgi:hypothetical protein